jgi:hypothetical protein
MFICGYGIYGFSNTDYEVLLKHTKDNTYTGGDTTRYIYMFNSSFNTLAGMLGIGYFLHTVSIPIVKNNRH